MKIKKWEMALALGLMFTVLLGSVWAHRADAAARQLSEKLMRLHVLANSDSPQDQELKLRVRDRIVAEASVWLDGAADSVEAAKILQEHSAALAEMAAEEIAEAGYDYRVAVSVGPADFPTREYDGFALPAGRYQALRVVIGEGKGQNWWCVVFPPLCVSAAEQTIARDSRRAGLSDGEVKLITEGSGQYALRFKSVEIWQNIKRFFGWN